MNYAQVGSSFMWHACHTKRYPNNARTTWVCNNCRIATPKSRPSETVCFNSETPISSSSSPASIPSKTLQSEPSTSTSMGSQTSKTNPDVLFIGTTNNLNVDKTSSLHSLTERDFALIGSPCGWLDGAIIHQAQLCLKKINPNIEGFQRPTLGLCKNFDVVGGEFVQLLHTGGNHWVCLSSIGCTKGHVNLYNSLFHDVI